jgi:hypothetical protein
MRTQRINNYRVLLQRSRNVKLGLVVRLVMKPGLYRGIALAMGSAIIKATPKLF